MSIEMPVVAPEYDYEVRTMDPPPGKSIIYVYQPGKWICCDLPVSTPMEKAWDGFSRYLRLHRGRSRDHSTTHDAANALLEPDHGLSHRLAQCLADLEIEADRKYFIELRNSLKPLKNDTGYLEYIDKKYRLRRPTEEQLRIDFETVQLSFSNRYDAETLGYPKHPTVDHCPWGTDVSHDSDPLPCTYHGTRHLSAEEVCELARAYAGRS